MNKNVTIIGFIVSFAAGMMLMWTIDKSAVASTDATHTSPDEAVAAEGPRQVNPGAVEVDLHVMSQCPYGVQAENGFKEVVEKLGPDVDLELHFIGDNKNGQLTSMHGAKEVKGDLVQICAMKHTPKWFDVVLCQNKNARQVDTNWEACAKQVGAPVEKIRACAEGPEGQKLLAASFEESKKKGARGSPTIFIAGQKYQGGRRSSDFFKAVCNGFSGKKPAACANIPESPKVNMTLLTDKRCKECDPKRLEGQLRSRIANPVVQVVDYTTPAGKKLYDEVGPAKLPIAVFDKTIDADKEAMQALGKFLKAKGKHKVIAVGGSWNPACADEGGCELEECAKTLQCRKEEPNTLEVFVMSQCPFGVKGLNAMEEVLKNFADNNASLAFKINFIGDGDESKLTSMHGQAEVDEDLREICAIHHYPEKHKFMDYILCRNKNIKSPDWESCTGGDTGFDTEVIRKCSEGDEGKKLLAESFAYSKSLGIGASPTWLANGRYKFSGVDPETIKTNVCSHNELAGCDKKLSGPPARPAAGGKQPGCGD
jgi:predicted DsbA family dithiol-disulfide isomerase